MDQYQKRTINSLASLRTRLWASISKQIVSHSPPRYVGVTWIISTFSHAAQASLTPTLTQQALDRDKECIFSGVVLNHGVDAMIATWVFPPFLGYTVRRTLLHAVDHCLHCLWLLLSGDKLSSDQWLEYMYQDDPDACDLSEFMVAENVVSGLKDIIALFCDNKIGIDVDVGIRRFVHYLAKSKYP
jgi:hypothetical protein